MSMTRKSFLKLAAVAAGASASVAAAGPALGSVVRGNPKGGADSGTEDGELVRADPFQGVLDAMDKYPLVGIVDPHLNEQAHTFVRSLIQMRETQNKIDDIALECGNSFFQSLSDRFFLDLETIDDTELANMWRTTIGGRVYWDAPVYEQLYRTVRSVNEKLPCKERIRVLLADSAVDWSQIQSAADADKIPAGDDRETSIAGIIEQEVLAKNRRALIFAGGGHLNRGTTTTPGGLIPPRNPNQPNAGTIIAQDHPGALFNVGAFSLVMSDINTLPQGIPQRAEDTMAPWPVPSLTTLAGTWLGTQPMTFRAIDPNTTYEQETDAILWAGTDDALTCSRPDAALYQSGAYADELRRRSQIISEITGTTVDLVAEGLHLASLGPSCSER